MVEKVCVNWGPLEETALSPGMELFYWENSEHVVWLYTEIVIKGDSLLLDTTAAGFLSWWGHYALSEVWKEDSDGGAGLSTVS